MNKACRQNAYIYNDVWKLVISMYIVLSKEVWGSGFYDWIL